jgi:hypothetical protein
MRIAVPPFSLVFPVSGKFKARGKKIPGMEKAIPGILGFY